MRIDKPSTIEMALRGAINTRRDFSNSADSISAIVNTISNKEERENLMDMLIDFLGECSEFCVRVKLRL